MKKVFRLIFRFLLVSFVLGLLSLIITYLVVSKDLPDVETLREVQLQVPLRVYTQDGKLISVFGEKRRIPIKIDEIPVNLKRAFIAGEDKRFYEHPGIDYEGITRAAWTLATTGEKSIGNRGSAGVCHAQQVRAALSNEVLGGANRRDGDRVGEGDAIDRPGNRAGAMCLGGAIDPESYPSSIAACRAISKGHLITGAIDHGRLGAADEGKEGGKACGSQGFSDDRRLMRFHGVDGVVCYCGLGW